MKVGDLVKITRASIGMPKGTFGLITNTNVSGSGVYHHQIDTCGIPARQGGPRWFFERDLETISESR
jgi:hypothetical protein